MDQHLLKYFKKDNVEDALEKLKETIKLKSQNSLYDYIYIDFIRNNEVYDKDTPVEKLYLAAHLFVLTFYYRDQLFTSIDNNLQNDVRGINWMIQNMENKVFSTVDFMDLCYRLSCYVDSMRKFDENNTPLLIKTKNQNINISVHLDCTATNKYFYCPLVGKAGLLYPHSMYKMLITSIFDNGFSKIPLSLKTHSQTGDTSPHSNSVVTPLEMFYHDYSHVKHSLSYIKHIDYSNFKILHDSINRNIYNFGYRVLSVAVWYIIYDHPSFGYPIRPKSPTRHNDFIDFLDKFLKLNIVYFDGVDLTDQLYILEYIRNSRNFPEELDEYYDYFIKTKYGIQRPVLGKIFNNLFDNLIIFRPSEDEDQERKEMIDQMDDDFHDT